MTQNGRRALCGLLCAALLLGAAAALFHWADRRYVRRLAAETRTRYQGGVLQGENFRPLDGPDAVRLLERALSPAAGGPELALIPCLPDYGGGLDLRRVGPLWRLSYRTLDGLEVRADYSPGGQEVLTVYLPGPDLEVRVTGGKDLGYTPHARRSVTLTDLWTALRAELETRL